MSETQYRDHVGSQGFVFLQSLPVWRYLLVVPTPGLGSPGINVWWDRPPGTPGHIRTPDAAVPQGSLRLIDVGFAQRRNLWFAANSQGYYFEVDYAVDVEPITEVVGSMPSVDNTTGYEDVQVFDSQGRNINLGQQLMSASLPVVLPSDQVVPVRPNDKQVAAFTWAPGAVASASTVLIPAVAGKTVRLYGFRCDVDTLAAFQVVDVLDTSGTAMAGSIVYNSAASGETVGRAWDWGGVALTPGVGLKLSQEIAVSYVYRGHVVYTQS